MHLTDRCNNRCRFCMVDEIHGQFSFPYETALELIDKLPAGSKVDLFGGEPTLYQHFFDLLQYIQSKRLKCSIATNGRLFSKREFTDKVAAITGGECYIRTSLLGLSAEVHDRLTGVKGSYAELIAGLDHIVSAAMPCQVNIVITTDNLRELSEITKLAIDKGVPRIKFGLIVDAQSSPELVPTLDQIRPQLSEAVQIAENNGLTVTVEKAPLCLLPEYMNQFSSESVIGKWPRFYDDTGECGVCVARNWCDGLDPQYAAEFGTAGIRRIEKIPRKVLTPFPNDLSNGNQIRFLKLNLFAMPQKFIEHEQCEMIMLNLIEQTRQKHARIAFIDNNIVR
nr:radical SAM protein [Dehalobacterium formicoaceticum]